MLLCIQFLPRMAIVKFDVDNRNYAHGGLTIFQQNLICSSDLLTEPANLAANTKSSEVGVESFYFLKTKNQRKDRCRMWIKQCGWSAESISRTLLFVPAAISFMYNSKRAFVYCVPMFVQVFCCSLLLAAKVAVLQGERFSWILYSFVPKRDAN